MALPTAAPTGGVRKKRLAVTGGGGGPVVLMAEARRVLADERARHTLDELSQQTSLLEAGKQRTLTRRLFGAMVGRIDGLPLPSG